MAEVLSREEEDIKGRIVTNIELCYRVLSVGLLEDIGCERASSVGLPYPNLG